MNIKNLGTVTKCMNPEKDCKNVPDPKTAHVVVYKGKPYVLCHVCGPEIRMKVALEKQTR